MKKTLFLFLHAAAATCASAASQYTWINGSTDWESEASYVEEGKPAAGDIVYFPANTTGRVDDASIAFVSTLGRIALHNPSSVLVIDISTNATLGCGVNRNDILYAGTVYKRGAGTLQLALSDTYSYHTAWIIEEGDLKMPQDVASSSTQSYYGSITVNKGCTLYTMYHGRSRVSEIWGEGLVTNVSETSSEYLDVYGYGITAPCVFPGVIAGGTRVYSRGNVYLTGTNNTFLGTCSAYYYNSAQTLGTTGLRKIGMAGEPSSSGVGSYLTTRESSGRFRYLGVGETTDKVFQFDYSTTRPAEFDAGETGGITFTGTWKFPETSAPQMQQLVLNGSNTAECVFSNAFTSYTRGGTNFTYYIRKTGSGIWRFADNPGRKQTGVLAVDEGTVRFDSLAESNEVCSLGLSTTLYKDVTGIQDPANRVDYAFLLGGVSSTGTLEYTGADIALCRTRPLAVKGQGRLKNSGGQLRIGGISSEGAGTSTLFLDGVSGDDNLLYDVTDGGGGTLSLVKEGAGKWILAGEQSLSGPVDVRAGTLVVKNLTGKPYTWFRFTMKENGYECDRYNTTGIGDDPGAARRIYSLSEFALYDGANRRQNLGLGTNSTVISALRPGNT
ncbi:MAG: autotransporter-associated beta strand repeat-containing protein, partial [Kiritimatiellae bacterium]|nr:autotransporter-associated beta strand repeat-containing protein [Kiritimatiellia bacterium]